MESHVWFRDNYLVVTFHLTMCLSHSRTFSNNYACLYIVLSYQIIPVQSVSAGTRESHGTIGEPRYNANTLDRVLALLTKASTAIKAVAIHDNDPPNQFQKKGIFFQCKKGDATCSQENCNQPRKEETACSNEVRHTTMQVLATYRYHNYRDIM